MQPFLEILTADRSSGRTRRRWHRLGSLLGSLGLLVLLACGAPGAWRENLEPLPEPDVSRFETAVQEQLEQRHRQVEDALADELPPQELAEAFGELGRHYDVYELLQEAEVCYRNARQLAPEDPRWTYHLAVVMQSTGRLSEAASLFRRVLELQPDDLPAQVRLGETLADDNRPEEARQALQRAIALDADSALAHYFLGLLENGQGHAEEAVAHLQKALQLQPQATIVHYALAQALRAAGRGDEARVHAAQVGSEEVRLVDPLIQALGDLRAGAAAHIRRAAKAQVEGYYEAARQEYERAIAADPSNPEAHQGLAAMLVELDDLDGASRHFQKALDLGASNGAQVHFNLGALEIMAGRTEAGLEHYRQALEIDPQLTAVRFAAAKALADVGRFEDATVAYREILQVEPQSIAARLNLGLALARQGNVAAAKEVQREVLTRDLTAGERAEALSHLAALEAGTGNLEEAERLYRQAVEASAQNSGAWFGLGNLLGRQGRYAEAIEAYSASLEIDSKNPRAWLGEATARVLLEDWSAAKQRLEAALQELPDDVELAQTLARLLVTCPDATTRDTALGLQLAEQVFARSRTLEAADTVAMALAAEGRAAEAAALQSQIVSQLEAAGQTDAAVAARAQLDLYHRQAAIR